MTDYDDWAKGNDVGAMLDFLARVRPLDPTTARRFGAACLLRLGPLLTEHQLAVASWWEEDSACVWSAGPEPDAADWTARDEAGEAVRACAEAVQAGDARTAAAQSTRAVCLSARAFATGAVRQACAEAFGLRQRYPARDEFPRYVDKFLENAWDPVWRAAWTNPPAVLSRADVAILEGRLREYKTWGNYDPDGWHFRRMLEEWMESAGDQTREQLEAEMLRIACEGADRLAAHEDERQSELLIAFVRAPVSEFPIWDGHGSRRPRLYAAARARSVWHLLTDERSRRAVEVAERRADEVGSAAELAKALSEANAAEFEAASAYDRDPTDDNLCAYQAAWLAGVAAYESADAAYEEARADSSYPAGRTDAGERDAVRAEACWHRTGVADLARLDAELLDDRGYRTPFDSAWATETVLAVARGIYRTHAFDGMLILAEALQDAGCDNDDILDHCRRGGPHARGCWVLDLILRKP